MECKVSELVRLGHDKAAQFKSSGGAVSQLISDLATQLDVQLSRGNALAAENAGLKAALHPSDIPSELTDAFGDTAVIEHDSTGDNQGHSVSWSWVGNQEEVIKSVLLAVDKGIETPATDAFLAEVRAQGVEMAACALDDVNQFNYANMLDNLAQKIRKGVQS